MDFDTYQDAAERTAIYPRKGLAQGLTYAVLGLVGEAGEVANKVKKILRDHDGNLTDALIADVRSELGDVLWYLAACHRELNISLDGTAEQNLAKLERRKRENQLKGQGDNR